MKIYKKKLIFFVLMIILIVPLFKPSHTQAYIGVRVFEGAVASDKERTGVFGSFLYTDYLPGDSAGYYYMRNNHIKVSEYLGGASSWKTPLQIGPYAPETVIGETMHLTGQVVSVAGYSIVDSNSSTIQAWTYVFNGSEPHVIGNITKPTISCEDDRPTYGGCDNKRIPMTYLGDIAKLSGSAIKFIREDPVYKPNGEISHYIGIVHATVSEFPFINSVTVPATVTAGSPVNIQAEAEEYSIPTQNIRYEIKITKPDGSTDTVSGTSSSGADNGRPYNGSSTSTKHSISASKTYSQDGTYTVKVLAWDGVERPATEKTATFTIGSGGSTPPPGGGSGGACSPVISSPSAGTSITGTMLLPSATGSIRADSRGSERFDVSQGIPTSESLYANALTKDYLYKHDFAQMTGTVTYTVKVKKTYNLTWKEVKTTPPVPPATEPTTTETPKNSTEVVEQTYTVERPYSYWQINNLEVYGLQNAVLNNYALPGGSVTLSPNGYTAPTVDAVNSDDVNQHVFPSDCDNIDLGSETIDGGTSQPSVPSEDWQGDAEGAVGQNEVKNDKVIFKGSTIMSDARVVENGPNPTSIPAPTTIGSNVLYQSGLMISSSKQNAANTPSNGTVNYNLIKGIKGGSPKSFPISGINTVTVHTPTVSYTNVSDDSTHNQRTTPDYSRRAVILDRPFTISMPTSGQHRSIPGYGNRDYAKYIERKQVLFPFDVYESSGGVRGTFHRANSWIEVPVAQTSKEFFLPVWVNEGSYDGYFRVFAENSPSSGFTTETNANTIVSNHVATKTIPLDVIGRVFDFRVTDIADYNWENVFRATPRSPSHKGNHYWVERKDIDGNLRGNALPYTLPILPGSHPSYPNVSVKTGYHFKFDLKTKGNMFSENDGIRITPTFYFVNKDGTGRQQIDLYYHKNDKKFIKIGSPEDTERRYVILGDRLRNVPHAQIVNTADYIFDHYSGISTSSKTYFIQDYLEKTLKKTWVGKYDWMILPYEVKTHIGPLSVPAGASVNTQRANASIQQWYGEYSIPPSVYAVPMGTNIAEYGRMNRLSDKSPIFLKNGYIIVNFNIETIRNGNLASPHLQYIHAPLTNQWDREGFPNQVTSSTGHVFTLRDGDIMFYHGDKSSYDDFESRVTH
ncbi:DUF5704 domain-containing protein [Bacillus salitolerans]|uniref:DUF5704 domain-containing protein n=1 Tax=Bacillus salitolerans TaxID=1437434 RepID=A0ABW4LMA3_9BACI